MLRIFRNLRKSFLSAENFRKYIFYAIGEILLVMIGILLALQVNNWNENKKNGAEARKIKQNIHKEFIENSKILQSSRISNERAFNANLILSDLCNAEKSVINAHNLDSLFNYSLNFETYIPSVNSLDDVLQSGRLNLLDDDKLKNAILSWGASLDLFHEYYSNINDFMRDQYMPHLLPTVSFKNMNIFNKKKWADKTTFNHDYFPVLQDIKLENMLYNNLFLLDFMMSQLDSLEQNQEIIIELTKPEK